MLGDIIINVGVLAFSLLIFWVVISGIIDSVKYSPKKQDRIRAMAEECLSRDREALQQEYEQKKAQLQKEFEEKETKRRKEFEAEIEARFQNYIYRVQEYEDLIKEEKQDYFLKNSEFKAKQRVAMSAFKKATLQYQNTYKIFESICNGRMNNAFDTDLYIKNLNISATVGSGDHYYEQVTLTKCECEDFKHTKLPCKHMIFLIYSLGVLQLYRDECYKKDNWTQDIYALQAQKKDLEKKIKGAKETQKKIDNKVKSLSKVAIKADEELKELIEKRCSAYPQFAAMYSDVYTYYYDLAAQMLREKSHPAKGEAFRIEELRCHTKKHIEEKKIFEYQLGFARELYPGISQIFDKDFDPQDAPVLEPNKKIISKKKTKIFKDNPLFK